MFFYAVFWLPIIYCIKEFCTTMTYLSTCTSVLHVTSIKSKAEHEAPFFYSFCTCLTAGSVYHKINFLKASMLITAPVKTKKPLCITPGYLIKRSAKKQPLTFFNIIEVVFVIFFIGCHLDR